MKSIYAGTGWTTRGDMYINPLIEGISDRLWKDIANHTCELHPMYGKDGSAVYIDIGDYAIYRKVNGKRIKIADIIETEG